MAATIQISETNGPSTSKVETADVANINFGSIAQADLDPATNPISIGTAPRSFEKWLRMYVSAMGGSSIIDNIRIWISSLGGGYKTGESIKSNLTTDQNRYSAASYPSAGPANTLSTVATRDMPTTEPVQANVGIGGQLAGQITVAGYSDYAVLQMQVTASTPAGAVNQKVISIEWDEQ